MVRGPVHRVIRVWPLLDIFVLGAARSGLERLEPRRWRDARQRAGHLADDAARALEGDVEDHRVRSTVALVIPDDDRQEELRECRRRCRSVANAAGDAAVPDELEWTARPADAVRSVRNVVWITADVHYAAAHHFDPARGTGTQFDPFWGVRGRSDSAEELRPEPARSTFGPEVRFQWVPPADRQDLGPWDGLQNFRHARRRAPKRSP
jgi:alkaline phosphatase D